MGGPPPFISTFHIYAVSWEDVDHFVHITLEVTTTAFWFRMYFLTGVFSLFPKPDFKKLKSLIHWKMFKFPERKYVSNPGISMIFHALSLSKLNVLLSIKFMYFETFFFLNVIYESKAIGILLFSLLTYAFFILPCSISSFLSEMCSLRTFCIISYRSSRELHRLKLYLSQSITHPSFPKHCHSTGF